MAWKNQTTDTKQPSDHRTLAKKFMLAASFTTILTGCGSSPHMTPVDGNNHNNEDQDHHSQHTENTDWSDRLSAIEQQGNAVSAMPIIILNEDQILMEEARDYRTRLELWLLKQGVELDRRDLSGLYRSMGGNYGQDTRSPRALKTQASFEGQSQEICIVIPENPNLSNTSQFQDWLGNAGDYEAEVIATAPLPGKAYAAAERVVWHELWHCLDNVYEPVYRNLDHNADPAAFGLAVHRSEMFADIAAALTMEAKGHSGLTELTADARAIRSRNTGPRLMQSYTQTYDFQYYGGITYYTTPGLDAVPAAFNQIPAADQQDLKALGRVAYDLIETHSLNSKDYMAIASYLATGSSTQPIAQHYAQRTAEAQNRRTRSENNRPVRRAPDQVPPTIDARLDLISGSEKDSIRTQLLSGTSEGLPPRRALVAEFERWRKAVHTHGHQPDTAAERRLYVATLMMQGGLLNDVLMPETPACRGRSGPCS